MNNNTPGLWESAAKIFGEAADVFARYGVAERAQLCREWRDAALECAKEARATPPRNTGAEVADKPSVVIGEAS